MIEMKQKDNHMSIDVREQILRGQHPRQEILNAVKEAPNNTLIEIHVPHRTQPLIAALESMGLNVVINQIGPAHVRLMVVKL